MAAGTWCGFAESDRQQANFEAGTCTIRAVTCLDRTAVRLRDGLRDEKAEADQADIHCERPFPIPNCEA